MGSMSEMAIFRQPCILNPRNSPLRAGVTIAETIPGKETYAPNAHRLPRCSSFQCVAVVFIETQLQAKSGIPFNSVSRNTIYERGKAVAVLEQS